jgi:hypothetical protein
MNADVSRAAPRISVAPDLGATDGDAPIVRARRQPLMLGLFLPLQQGAWSPSTWTRGTSWSFGYNAAPGGRPRPRPRAAGDRRRRRG